MVLARPLGYRGDSPFQRRLIPTVIVTDQDPCPPRNPLKGPSVVTDLMSSFHRGYTKLTDLLRRHSYPEKPGYGGDTEEEPLAVRSEALEGISCFSEGRYANYSWEDAAVLLASFPRLTLSPAAMRARDRRRPGPSCVVLR